MLVEAQTLERRGSLGGRGVGREVGYLFQAHICNGLA